MQGVGFRWAVIRLAAGRPVAGYVRNEADGSVRLVAEGTGTALAEFLRAIGASAVGEFITGQRVDWHEATGRFRSFDIRY